MIFLSLKDTHMTKKTDQEAVDPPHPSETFDTLTDLLFNCPKHLSVPDLLIKEYERIKDNWDTKYKSLTNVALRTDCPVIALNTPDYKAALSTLQWPQLPLNGS